MKIFRFLAVALVAMFGLVACNNDCEHEFIEVDYSADLVGTWTCLEADHAAAYIFNADGTVATTGIDGEAYWEDEKGTYSVVNNKITMEFESGRIINGSFDIIPGQAISIVGEKGRHTYQYCKEDLADEVVGMWVCNDGLPGVENDMAIITYSEDGKMTMTAPNSIFIPDNFTNRVSDYKVVGDLVFKIFPNENFAEGGNPYLVSRVAYTPNGTSLGDILIEHQYTPSDNGIMELTFSFLRVRQTLDLPNQKYDYSNIYITNVKAKDAEFEFAGQTLNLATMNGKFLDKMLKNILFNVSFPTSDEIVYNCYYNGESVSMPSPIVVDGNKMTIKKSAKNPAFKDIDVWAFQDQNNTQMHMYMPTYAFENFIANTAVELMAQEGKLDLSDAEAVAAIYDAVAEAIETINVSFIFKDATRAL